MILSPAELTAFTGRRRASAQARQLEAWGIPYRRRNDGSIAVLRVHAEYLPGTMRPSEPAVNLEGL